MTKVKREANKILFYGKKQKLDSQNGNLLGDKVVQVGILSALLWRAQY
jgi:hypothetical protein